MATYRRMLQDEDGNNIIPAGILDVIYPIGSIYMSATLTTATAVGNALGGTWEAWGAGRVPVGVDSTQTEFNNVEKTGGSKSMQKHSHTRGTMNITGSMDTLSWNNQVGLFGLTASGAFYKKNTYPQGRITAEDTYWGSGSDSAALLGLDASRNWTGATSEEGTGTSGNLQPYITCYMYKRTA